MGVKQRLIGNLINIPTSLPLAAYGPGLTNELIQNGSLRNGELAGGQCLSSMQF